MLPFIVNLGMAILVLISSSIQMASTNSTLNQILLALPITIVIFNGQIYSSGLISTYLIEITLNAVAAIGRLSLMVFVVQLRDQRLWSLLSLEPKLTRCPTSVFINQCLLLCHEIIISLLFCWFFLLFLKHVSFVVMRSSIQNDVFVESFLVSKVK